MPPPMPAVYVIFCKLKPEEKPNDFTVIYVGECENLKEVGFPFKHKDANRWISSAKNKFNFGLAVCFSSLIFTASTCAFLGYLVDINIAYSWGNLTYMAINTTFCFMLMGIGLGGKVFHISHKNEIKN